MLKKNAPNSISAAAPPQIQLWREVKAFPLTPPHRSQRPPDTLAGFKGPTSMGSEGMGGRRGKEGMEW